MALKLRISPGQNGTVDVSASLNVVDTYETYSGYTAVEIRDGRFIAGRNTNGIIVGNINEDTGVLSNISSQSPGTAEKVYIAKLDASYYSYSYSFGGSTISSSAWGVWDFSTNNITNGGVSSIVQFNNYLVIGQRGRVSVWEITNGANGGLTFKSEITSWFQSSSNYILDIGANDNYVIGYEYNFFGAGNNSYLHCFTVDGAGNIAREFAEDKGDLGDAAEIAVTNSPDSADGRVFFTSQETFRAYEIDVAQQSFDLLDSWTDSLSDFGDVVANDKYFLTIGETGSSSALKLYENDVNANFSLLDSLDPIYSTKRWALNIDNNNIFFANGLGEIDPSILTSVYLTDTSTIIGASPSRLILSGNTQGSKLSLSGVLIIEPIMILITDDYGGLNTFDPVFAVTSGILEWDLGDGSIVNANSFTHKYYQEGNKTVKIYKGTTSGVSSITGVQIQYDNIVGELDLSKLTNLGGYAYLHGNTKMTSVINPISSKVFSTYYVNDSSLNGTLDLTGLTGLGGDFRANSNPNLTQILNPDSSQAFTYYYVDRCNLTGVLDVSSLTKLGGDFRAYNNKNLTQILNPESPRLFTFYWASGCDLTGTLDLRNLSGFGGYFAVFNNRKLTQILNPDSSQAFTAYNAYDCSLNGTLDVSSLTGLGGQFQVYNNPNLTQILNPNSPRVFSEYRAYGCNLTGTLDLSGLTGLGGTIWVHNNPNLTGVLNPDSSQAISNYSFYGCDLTGTLDLRGLTGLGGNFNVNGMNKITQILNPVSSRTFATYWAYDCSLSGTLDCSGLTGLGGNFVVRNHKTLHKIIFPTSSTAWSALDVNNNDLLGTLDISGLLNPTSLYIHNNYNLCDILLPSITKSMLTFDAGDCSLSQVSIDNIFSKLNTYYTSSAPTSSLNIDVAGGTNMPPTDGSSNSDILSLETIFNTAGKTLTITINT